MPSYGWFLLDSEPTTGADVRIAVLGATGRTGRQIVGQALARGYDVTALARHANNLASHPRLRCMAADARDECALSEAITGADAVLSAVGTHQRGGDVRVYSDVMRATVVAMRSSGVRRLVCVSAAGVGMERAYKIPWLFRVGVIPVFARAEYADMERMETLVAASYTDWTIVRPLWLRPSLSQSGYSAYIDGPVRGRGIRREELGRFMLDCVNDEHWIRQRVWVESA